MQPRDVGIYLGTKPGMGEGLLAASCLWLTKPPSLKKIIFALTYPGKPMAASFPRKGRKVIWMTLLSRKYHFMNVKSHPETRSPS